MEINMRFYEGYFELSNTYFKNLSNIFTDPAGQQYPQPVRANQGASSLVLEAEAGEQARSYFMVENLLSKRVSAEVIGSPLIDADGKEVEQKINFEPSGISLDPGEKTVVQVVAEINDRLTPGVGYRGSIAVPGLSESSVAMVVRRRHSVDRPEEVKKPARKKTESKTTTRRSPQSSSRKKKQS